MAYPLKNFYILIRKRKTGLLEELFLKFITLGARNIKE